MEPRSGESKCRFCCTQLTDTMVDLGMSPLSNSYLTVEQLNVNGEMKCGTKMSRVWCRTKLFTADKR
ncbi:hypothetical protein [Desulforamulus aeronauticus]|uniref:hypothetical protein n=1 Tax=Desulforamulus aeronauticus TaxID=53343 RepID=UPI001114C5F1